MITYFSFEPRYFNNNGDQGNLEVLLKILRDSGYKTKPALSLRKADFVLVGDASIAVMERFSKNLSSMRDEIRRRFEAGRPTLIVGSSYEYFSEELGLQSKKTKRKSGFVTTSDGFFGYRNSDTTLPEVFIRKAFVGTKLFGPALAKNPKLLELQLTALGRDLAMPLLAAGWVELIRQNA
jgi:CobQ-like glutamine amidotransferase family enzyme